MQGLGLGSLRRKGKFFPESSIIFLYSKVYIYTHTYTHACACGRAQKILTNEMP